MEVRPVSANPNLLTQAEAADYLRMSVSRLRALSRQGLGPPRIPHYRRPVMYSRSALDIWLSQEAPACTSTAAPQPVPGTSRSSTEERASVSRRSKEIAAKVTEERLREYIAHRRGHVRGQTIAKELGFLRRGLEIAERKGWISKLPKWPTVKHDPAHPARKGRFIPPESLRAFLLALPEDLAEELLFDALTGLRGGELRNVTVAWVEPAPANFPTPAILRVPAWATKNRKDRAVGLPSAAVTILERRAAKAEPGAALFPHTQAVKVRKDAAHAAGLTFVPHRRDLRHTYATLGDYLTGDRKAVSDAMGHTTERMTSKYLHSWNSRTAEIGVAVAGAVAGGDKAGVTRQKAGAKKREIPAGSAALSANSIAALLAENPTRACQPKGACPLCGCVAACSTVQRDSADLAAGGGDATGVTVGPRRVAA